MNMSIDKTWPDRNPSLRGMSCTCLQIFLFRCSYSYYGDVLIWFLFLVSEILKVHIMKRRSSLQLRPRGKVNQEKNRSRSVSLPKTGTKEYERDRKRKQHEKGREGKENVKRGRKETISISLMSFEEKRKYERERKALQRQKRKIMSLQSSTNDQLNESSDVNEDEEDETDFSFDDSVNKEEAGAIINMIQNSPTKKRKTEKAFQDFKISRYLFLNKI